ncbi:MAG: YgiT-type zinc finger protein [Acidobacteriota bacterium]|nr:YgiT-type zinc finger protein [Acidobacteriota bacterium]
MEQDFCEYCNATLPEGERLVTVYRHRRGQHFIFERVPARVCPRCGERYLSAHAAREMDRLMRKAKQPTNLVPVPVIELQPAG